MKRFALTLVFVASALLADSQSLDGMAYGGGEYEDYISFKGGRFEYLPFYHQIPNETFKGTYTLTYEHGVPILRLNGDLQISMVFLHNDSLAQITLCNYFGESSVLVSDKANRVINIGSTKHGAEFIATDYRVTATSFLAEGLREYRPENLTSSALAGPWVAGVPGGIGQRISIDFSQTNGSGTPTIMVNGLLVSNGYVSQYHPEYYEYNNRVRRFTITSQNPAFTKSYDLQDTPNLQIIKLPARTSGVTVVIEDIFKGTKFNDTAINLIYGITSLR